MDFLNKTVIHKSLGTGIVIEYNHPYFKVKFGNRISPFSFPQSFNGFLRFCDERDQIELEQLIKEEHERQEKEQARWSYSSTTSSISGSAPKTLRYSTVPKRPKNEKPNIAIKSNFCDGGSNKYHIGFLGACSDKLIRYNSEVARHSWCTDPDSPCQQYLTGEIDRWELDEMCKDGGHVCYESQMLREWAAFAGYVLTGEKRDEPKKIRNVQVNSLAILTTREPYANEEDRIIFGVFLVDEAEEGGAVSEGFVRSNSQYRLELSPQEAKQIKFWNYHANGNNPEKAAWSQGLYRYITDIEATQILRDIVAVKSVPAQKMAAQQFLEHFCTMKKISIDDIPEANGALKRSVR